MATTINSYADGLEDFIASGAAIEPLEGGCKAYKAKAVITLASQAAGEDIAVFLLKKGTTLWGGNLYASATLDNSAQLSVGLMGADGSGYVDAANTDADDVAQFKAAAAQGTTLVPFCATVALGYGYTLEKDCYLTISTSVGTVATESVWVVLDYTAANN